MLPLARRSSRACFRLGRRSRPRGGLTRKALMAQGADGAGGEKQEQEDCDSQPRDRDSQEDRDSQPSDRDRIVSTSCAQRRCLEQPAHHGVAGDNAKSTGEHIAQRPSSATPRPTSPEHGRDRTRRVGAQPDADARIRACDAAGDTALVLAAAAAAEGAVGTTTKGQAGRKMGGAMIWGSVRLKAARKCCNPPCTRRSTKGCSCDEFCTDKASNASGVLMCRR